MTMPFAHGPFRWLLGGVLLISGAILQVTAAEKVEEYASGKPKGKYKANDAGDKDGAFTEFFENGKIRAKGTYAAGKLQGTHTSYYPTGRVMAAANYEGGALTGKYTESTPTGANRVTATYKDGELTSLKLSGNGTAVEQNFTGGAWVPPRRLAEVQLDLATIATTPSTIKATDTLGLDQDAALRRLMSYRAACRVPFDISLDTDMTAKAMAGAELCQALGRLEHKPMNTVKWAEDKFALGYEGTSHSNLFGGGNTRRPLATSVDAYMDDSDAGNIDRVGHRRWCLNPGMLKTGFGSSPSGGFAAMWSFDSSRKPVPEYDYVAYPPDGFAPIAYFGPTYAWSFSPNPARYQIPDPKAVTVKVYHKTDKSADKPGTEVKLNHLIVNTSIYGSGPAVIFRPQLTAIPDGSRYVVEINGLMSNGKAAPITYLVIFVTTN